jgi:hypothetical protein
VVYGQIEITRGSAWQCFRMLKHEKTNQQISPFILNDDDIQNVDRKFCERWRVTISEISCGFPLIYLTSFPQLEHAKL